MKQDYNGTGIAEPCKSKAKQGKRSPSEKQNEGVGVVVYIFGVVPGT